MVLLPKLWAAHAGRLHQPPAAKQCTMVTFLWANAEGFGDGWWERVNNYVEPLAKIWGQRCCCSPEASMATIERLCMVLHSWPYGKESYLLGFWAGIKHLALKKKIASCFHWMEIINWNCSESTGTVILEQQHFSVNNILRSLPLIMANARYFEDGIKSL